jgi:hypothetical protein
MSTDIVGGSGVLDRVKAFVNAERCHYDLLRLIADWYTLFHTAQATPEQRAALREVVRSMAPLYPKIVTRYDQARSDDSCREFFYDESKKQHISVWLLQLNTDYINHVVGCDCGKPVDLFSDSVEDNFGHHSHSVFRTWAWKHFTESVRVMMLRPRE